MYIIPRGKRRVILIMNTKTKEGMKVTLYLNKEEYLLFKELCQALNIPYSRRISELIHEDIQNLLSLVEILKKKKVKKE